MHVRETIRLKQIRFYPRRYESADLRRGPVRSRGAIRGKPNNEWIRRSATARAGRRSVQRDRCGRSSGTVSIGARTFVPGRARSPLHSVASTAAFLGSGESVQECVSYRQIRLTAARRTPCRRRRDLRVGQGTARLPRYGRRGPCSVCSYPYSRTSSRRCPGPRRAPRRCGPRRLRKSGGAASYRGSRAVRHAGFSRRRVPCPASGRQECRDAPKRGIRADRPGRAIRAGRRSARNPRPFRRGSPR